MRLVDHQLCLIEQPYPVRLTLSAWLDGQWRLLELQESGGGFAAQAGDVHATLELQQEAGQISYSLSFASQRPTRLQLRLEVAGARQPFHVIPGCIFGDNNMADSMGHAPSLTTEHPDQPSCSPYWELRADRAPLPISLLYCDGLIVAASIEAYSAGQALEAEMPEAFIRNGLFAALAHDGAGDACGTVLGHSQLPNFWSDESLPVIGHHSTGATARGRIYLRSATARTGVHQIIREEYAYHRELPATPISREAAVAALVDAFVRVNWHGENGLNEIGSPAVTMSPFFGGTQVRENFTNMRCEDAAKVELKAWRTLSEIGWAGGTAIADPLLVAGHRLNHPVATAHAIEILDRIAAGINPASGLLWDVVGKYEGKRVNWWWTGYMVQDCHCAYTNGNAVWHLLKAYKTSREWPGHAHENWLATARTVLDNVLQLQQANGSFGYTYATDRKAVLDAGGYAGVWFVAALALAHELTNDPRYLEAAQRGVGYYHALIAELTSWGTPMDQFKWPDQEGNLGLVRALPVLHRITGDARYLSMLCDAAGYEYLWRYGQRTRPQTPPLKDSHWNSCGGSMTGVFSWQHPMGMFINADLIYLAEQTGDDYHRQRAEDGTNWGINTVSLYPEVTEYGIRGVMTECYCQSNPRPKEFNADGSPATLWHSYNGWAAAATLEGLLEVAGV